MKTKKTPVQSKRALRTAIKEAWETFIKESDEAWRAYGRSLKPSWVARREVLEQIEEACKKAITEITRAREEAKHENQESTD
ncbi:MAG: hypothetical protein AMJ37_03590 [Dehalococcoidia bacterium DG_18]|nr:MAG: hypothetical protein AMJ37_03590 [Dehalococcoidia bacterium DG_18]